MYTPRFMACHPGLSAPQSLGLNRLQVRRCQALDSIWRLSLRGGSWLDAELREVCAILPRVIRVLEIWNMCDAWEADTIAEALADASPKHLVFQGSRAATCLMISLARCCTAI